MKKILLTLFLLLSQNIFAALFEHNTDMKSKYEFDIAQDRENERLATELARFQNDEVTQEEIDVYLKARDDNHSTHYAADVQVEGSLAIKNEESKDEEKSWLSQLYDSLFTSKEIPQDTNTSTEQTNQGAE